MWAKFLFQINELKDKMQSSGMPWPGDEGPERWEQAWMAIKKVNCILLLSYDLTKVLLLQSSVMGGQSVMKSSIDI